MSITMTAAFGTSNLRNSSRQTRTNPTRTSKTIGSSLRQNSLISNPPTSQGVNEPHGFYPAISHFADAIAALPRDYRRHTSLLKEVDAKAWAPEENLQSLLTQCLSEESALPTVALAQGAATSTANTTDEAIVLSAANSVNGAPGDAASQYSNHSAEPGVLQRRQVFAALRNNLMQIMVTMDEKNHVINNANEELSKHIRRLDNVWPHISDEISEDARLGSLKHWAYTETNPTKKVTAPTTRREAAASLAIMHESDIAQRSENRREAMLAKKQRLAQHVDSDFEDIRPTSRKAIASGKRRAGDAIADAPTLGLSLVGASKRKKPDKTLAGIGMERSLSSALAGGRAMSREPSQQDNTKKRKAPAAVSTVARKRLNASTHDSPKLASSPLAGSFGKDAYKRSPALSSARPVPSRSRQDSTAKQDGSRARPSSSASHRNTNGGGVSASTPELNSVAAMTGKTANEVRHTMKESTTSKGDRLLEDESGSGVNSDVGIRGGLLLERTASKQGGTKHEANTSDENLAKRVVSPRLPHILTTGEYRGERAGRGRASKTSTPIVGSFADVDSADSGTNGNGNGKPKRPARPRMKDHGLHDSLSPKGLPMKRSHKKGAGMTAQQLASQKLKEEVENASGLVPEGDNEDDEEENGVEDEERYCYCDGVSYGEMVACDNKDCPREWFHLDCIGLKSVPKSAKWYCDECKDRLKKGNGNGN